MTPKFVAIWIQKLYYEINDLYMLFILRNKIKKPLNRIEWENRYEKEVL